MNKKRTAIICFTSGGKSLAEKIRTFFPDAELIFKPKPLKQWMKEHFHALDTLIFIGAMGIIVRDMAPYLESKQTDPAVVVLDEKGQFIISVLSGHLGGANALTKELAVFLGAIPVITTASDVNHKIAIDVFAQKNDLIISSMKSAKYCASNIIEGEKVSFSCDSSVKGNIPLELSADRKDAKFHVIVSPNIHSQSNEILHLIPKVHILGIGCKKGTSAGIIKQRVLEELDKLQIDLRSVCAIASIELKKDEAGLLEFAESNRIPIHFYSSEELSALEGAFTPSAFVSQITGVENVCERAAFQLAKEKGMNTFKECLVMPKSGKDGVTVAITKIDWSVSFE